MQKKHKQWIVAALLVGLLVGAGFLVWETVWQVRAYTRFIFGDFAVVKPGVLVRYCQPEGPEWNWLEKHNVTAVVNLRPEIDMNTDESPRNFAAEKKVLAEKGVRFVHIPISDVTPSDDQIREFLRLVRSNKGATLVHCQLGRARTGMMVAAYRIVVDGWSADQATAEMVEYGDRPWKYPAKGEMLKRIERERDAFNAATAPTTTTTGAASAPATSATTP